MYMQDELYEYIFKAFKLFRKCRSLCVNSKPCNCDSRYPFNIFYFKIMIIHCTCSYYLKKKTILKVSSGSENITSKVIDLQKQTASSAFIDTKNLFVSNNYKQFDRCRNWHAMVTYFYSLYAR